MDFSGPAVIASMVVSTIGFGFFTYGRKQQRWPQLIGGLVMMIEPCLGGGALSTWITGALLSAAMVIALKLGF